MFWHFFHAFLFLEVVSFYSQSLSSLLRDFDWFSLFFLKFFHFPSVSFRRRQLPFNMTRSLSCFPKFFLWWKTSSSSEKLTASSIVTEGNFQSLFSLCCIPSLFWYVPRRHQHLDCCGHTIHGWMLSARSHWSGDLLNRRSWCLGTWQ